MTKPFIVARGAGLPNKPWRPTITARWARFLTTAMLTMLTSPAPAAPVPLAELAELQLRLINHRVAHAFSNADPSFMTALTAEDFRLIDGQGVRLDRAAHLARFNPTRALQGTSYDVLRVRLFGPVALLHGVFEAMDARGEPLRLRYTDVYHWDGVHWMLVAAQNTPLRAGVSKDMLVGTLPLHDGWKGSDPAGDDSVVLHRLNEHYVGAYRDADVAWYDAHLAPDYVVSNSDGSLSDRASALTAFARPSFATHFRSFPVGQVHIRRFGDMALIEAENAYVLKDGRTGISRYTDIWHQVGGRWWCVSAHLTPVVTP